MRLWKLIIVGSIAAVILWWLYPSRGMKTKEGVTELMLWAPGTYFLDMEPLLKHFEKRKSRI